MVNPTTPLLPNLPLLLPTPLLLPNLLQTTIIFTSIHVSNRYTENAQQIFKHYHSSIVESLMTKPE